MQLQLLVFSVSTFYTISKTYSVFFLCQKCPHFRNVKALRSSLVISGQVILKPRCALLLAADGGRGNPVFAGETDCTYYFDWETAFACVKEKEDLLCRVRDDNKHYDLSPLTRYPGEEATGVGHVHPMKHLFPSVFCDQACVAEIFTFPCVSAASGSDVGGNWEVVDAKSPNPDSRFYLNACHKVVQTGAAVGCPVNASICAVGKSPYTRVEGCPVDVKNIEKLSLILAALLVY